MLEIAKRKNSLSSHFWNLLPRPLPDSLLLDILYIFELVLIQDFVIPQFTGQWLFIDLLTPWLIILFVFKPFWRIALLGALTSFLLETHSGVSKGLFFCAYWVLASTLFYIRHNISWVNLLPWAATFLIAQSVLITFEGISYWTHNLSLFSFVAQVFFPKVLSGLMSVIFGLFMVYKFRLDTLEEHRLARR